MKRLTKRKVNFRYLNILRGFCLLTVSTYHLFGHALPGGFLAVIGFLVMSGFLMEKANFNRDLALQDILESLKRKAKKILPPIIFISSISLIVALIFAREIFDDSARSSLAVIFGFENIRQIVAGASYFDRNGNFNIFVHLWYISLYIQFIVIFYLVKYIGGKVRNISARIWGLIILSLISFGLCLYFAINNSPIIRIYYGTDTRIYAFFLGMAFYLLYLKYKDRLEVSQKSLRISIGLLGLCLFVPMFFINGEEIWIYRSFFLVYTLAFALMVLVLYRYEIEYGAKFADNIFGGILEYLGRRSFYLYILQYLVQVFFSYFLINLLENKFLYYGLQFAWIIFLGEVCHIIFNRKRINKYLILVPFAGLIILNIVSLAIGNQKEKDMAELKARFEQSEEEIKKNNESVQKKKASEDKKNKEDEKDKEVSSAEKEESYQKDLEKAKEDKNFKEKPYDDFNFTENELNYVKDIHITAVGDSVLINIDKYLRKYIPNLYLDGVVGRDMIDGPNVLANIKNNVGLGDIVLISLGSNGSANHNDMQTIMDLAEGRDVYFVNTSHLQSYMDKVNADMKEFVDKNPKAHLIDWRAYVKDRPELLAVDRTHPNVEGSQAYADLVVRKILNVNKVSD
ncbi:acyltransferase family protein [Anaerococcus degeneri]|uniref:Acyltransferase n=1 Tax=Anaerococcus degeneri TaxID=361500 RepID=A0ABS7YVG2_9FIRM|nr:acyltransferase family protein [Anaerococcus degeneri]MBP2015986.1 peptidoglycan/LPS O-acetylase OafA/YrhL [Anaerococcus degeneri]MCA2095732.1 acyltransferase [Anaerococcus degeneri]